MERAIALLRGINVGGSHKLPMKQLVRDLEALDLREVATYIQSGNVVFRAAAGSNVEWEERIAAAIEEGHGFRPRVMVLTAAELAAVVAACPYRAEGDAEPKAVHVFFLGEEPAAPDLAGLAALASPTERFELGARAFYLNAPDGIGRSRLAERVEKRLGVATTARNWRTVTRLLEMAPLEMA